MSPFSTLRLSLVRRRGCLVFLVLGVLLPFTFVFMFSSSVVFNEQTLVQRLAEIHVRLQYMDSLYRARQEDVVTLQRRISKLGSGPAAPVAMGCNGALGATQAIPTQQPPYTVRNLTGLRWEQGFNTTFAKSVRLPSTYHFLPHLLDNANSLRPAFLMSAGRTGVSVVLGIPTVKREKESYLMMTLLNIAEAMTEEEQADTLVVVFIASTDAEFIMQTAKQIELQFPNHIESGFIEVLAPPASYYPDMEKLRITFGDPIERVRWRAKQNLDFSFLMSYSQPKGTFYVQLEDDILAKKNFISTMKSYAIEVTSRNEEWFVLNFCQLGFIGKMFKSAELPWAITYFQMFYDLKPVDWLLDDLIDAKVCSLEKDVKRCRQRLKAYKPSLFQHIGTHSSLKGKIQTLKDKQFGKMSLFYPHANPSVQSIHSDVKVHKKFTLGRAYAGETFFWGEAPESGDKLTFVFGEPLAVKRYLFRSGNVEHPSDRFYNTSIEVLATNTPANATSDGYAYVGNFDTLGIAKGSIDPSLGKISAIRLHIHSDSSNWVILSEIHIETIQKR